MIEVSLAQIEALAAEAGALAMSFWRGEFDQWEKGPGDPVSEADIAVNRLLKERLTTLDPEAGWYSEETADSAERLMRSRVWVVDPIDGTRDFVRGRRGWCISIAMVEGGSAILGVLDAPARGEIWSAAVGQGARLNGKALHCASRDTLTGARVPADALPRVDSDLVLVEKPNSIALRIAMVAAGEADLVASIRWGHEWDIAAAALIAQEAGATVTDARGAALRYNSTEGGALGVLAACPGIHAAAVERLRERAAVGSG